MAEVSLVEKKLMMNHARIIKFQLISHCYINEIDMSKSDIDLLTLLGLHGECTISKFCNLVIQEDIFKTSQTVRNSIAKGLEKKLIFKVFEIKKSRVYLHPELQIQTKGNIVLNYKVGCIESN